MIGAELPVESRCPSGRCGLIRVLSRVQTALMPAEMVKAVQAKAMRMKIPANGLHLSAAMIPRWVTSYIIWSMVQIVP